MTEHVQDLLSAYMDAELEPEEQAYVRDHLAACSECHQFLEELRDVDRLARSLPDPFAEVGGTDLATRVRGRLLAEAAEGRGRGSRWLAAAAAVAALAVLPWLVLERSPPQEAMVTTRSPPEAQRAAAPQAPPPALTADKDVAEDEGKRGRMDASTPPPAPPAAPARSLADAPRDRGEAETRTKKKEQAPDDGFAEEPALPKTNAPGPLERAEREAAAPSEAAGSPTVSAAAEEAQRSEAEAEAFAATEGLAAAKRARQLESDEVAFRALAARNATSGAEARRLRDDWRAFVRRYPRSPRADRARRGVLNAGAAAYRLDRRTDDLDLLRRDVDEYVRQAPNEEATKARRLLDEAARTGSP